MGVLEKEKENLPNYDLVFNNPLIKRGLGFALHGDEIIVFFEKKVKAFVFEVFGDEENRTTPQD